MKRILKRGLEKLNTAKAKAGAVVVAVATGASNACAAVTVDPATGAISGSLEMVSFYGGAAVAGTAIGIVSAVLLGIGMLKKAR